MRRPPQNGRLTSHPYSVTDRQWDVWEQLAKGLSNAQIASALGLSVGTVKIHVANIMQATGRNTRTELVALYYGGLK